MRDRLLILGALAVFVAAATYPASRALATGTRPVPPALARSSVREACVLPAAEMRASHMRLLVEWRDLAVRKRKTEADPQLGPIVTLGAEVGVPAPLTAKVIEMIHEIEDGKRPMSLANLDALKRLAVSY